MIPSNSSNEENNKTANILRNLTEEEENKQTEQAQSGEQEKKDAENSSAKEEKKKKVVKVKKTSKSQGKKQELDGNRKSQSAVKKKLKKSPSEPHARKRSKPSYNVNTNADKKGKKQKVVTGNDNWDEQNEQSSVVLGQKKDKKCQESVDVDDMLEKINSKVMNRQHQDKFGDQRGQRNRSNRGNRRSQSQEPAMSEQLGTTSHSTVPQNRFGAVQDPPKSEKYKGPVPKRSPRFDIITLMKMARIGNSKYYLIRWEQPYQSFEEASWSHRKDIQIGCFRDFDPKVCEENLEEYVKWCEANPDKCLLKGRPDAEVTAEEPTTNLFEGLTQSKHNF